MFLTVSTRKKVEIVHKRRKTEIVPIQKAELVINIASDVKRTQVSRKKHRVNPGVPYREFITSNTANGGIRTCLSNDDIKFRRILSNSKPEKNKVTHCSYIMIDKYILPRWDDLSQESRKSIEIDNAGGKSDISEMFSIDYFNQVHKSTQTIYETQIDYWADYKMVDFICTMNNSRVGVSVARAMGYPDPSKFTFSSAQHLLFKKLYGLIVARNCVNKNHSFIRSVIQIWCQTENIANLLAKAFSNLDHEDYGLDIKGVVILQLTICDDPQLYQNFVRH